MMKLTKRIGEIKEMSGCLMLKTMFYLLFFHMLDNVRLRLKLQVFR